MFRSATQQAQRYTRPLVVSHRRWDGTTNAGVGTFVVLNADGWAITAGHMFDLAQKKMEQDPHVADFRKRLAEAEADDSLQARQRTRRIEKVYTTSDSSWITNISYWWSDDSVHTEEIIVVREVDLAVVRLKGLTFAADPVFPVFKNPKGEMLQATSLCRLGFPFPEVNTRFDEATGLFDLGSPQLPFFPNEGLFSRVIDFGRSPSGKHPHTCIETTSPGLRGQSGGPIYDRDGLVWGIQSRTQFIPRLRLRYSAELRYCNGTATVRASGRETQQPGSTPVDRTHRPPRRRRTA